MNPYRDHVVLPKRRPRYLRALARIRRSLYEFVVPAAMLGCLLLGCVIVMMIDRETRVDLTAKEAMIKAREVELESRYPTMRRGENDAYFEFNRRRAEELDRRTFRLENDEREVTRLRERCDR